MTSVIKTVDTNLEIDFNWKIPNLKQIPIPNTEVKINENALCLKFQEFYYLLQVYHSKLCLEVTFFHCDIKIRL